MKLEEIMQLIELLTKLDIYMSSRQDTYNAMVKYYEEHDEKQNREYAANQAAQCEIVRGIIGELVNTIGSVMKVEF